MGFLYYLQHRAAELKCKNEMLIAPVFIASR